MTVVQLNVKDTNIRTDESQSQLTVPLILGYWISTNTQPLGILQKHSNTKTKVVIWYAEETLRNPFNFQLWWTCCGSFHQKQISLGLAASARFTLNLSFEALHMEADFPRFPSMFVVSFHVQLQVFKDDVHYSLMGIRDMPNSFLGIISTFKKKHSCWIYILVVGWIWFCALR